MSLFPVSHGYCEVEKNYLIKNKTYNIGIYNEPLRFLYFYGKNTLHVAGFLSHLCSLSFGILPSEKIILVI